VIVEAPLAVVVALLGVGGVLLFGGVAGIRRLGHLRRTPVLPIAQAGENTFVAIRGTLVASEEGLVTAPFSERAAAWFKIVVEGKSGKSWETFVDESEGRVFLVDDGSGELARIDAKEATFDVASDLSSSGRLGTAPKLEAFLAARKLNVEETLAGMFGIRRMVRYTETALLPGETVLAVGHARRVAGPPIMDGYRSGSTTELVVAPSGRDQLLVSNRTREEIVREPRATATRTRNRRAGGFPRQRGAPPVATDRRIDGGRRCVVEVLNGAALPGGDQADSPAIAASKLRTRVLRAPTGRLSTRTPLRDPLCPRLRGGPRR
jgi:hypothetical protein